MLLLQRAPTFPSAASTLLRQQPSVESCMPGSSKGLLPYATLVELRMTQHVLRLFLLLVVHFPVHLCCLNGWNAHTLSDLPHLDHTHTY
jgi:hypothetical protein